MNFRRWTIALVITILVGTAIEIGANMIVDPFSVFGSNVLHYHIQQNQRVLKVEFLKDNHQRFNGYLLGSSRIGTTAPAVLERYLPGARLYNMTVQGATLLDDLTFAEYFVRQGYEVRYLYLQIDIDQILQDYDFPESLLLYRKHPATTGEPAWQFYLRYALAFPFDEIARKVRWNLAQQSDWMGDDIQASGRWYWPGRDEQIARDAKAYVDAEVTFHEPASRTIRDKALGANVEALRKLVVLCELNGIELYTFITPNHHALLDSYVIEDYLKATGALAQVTDLWDFGGYNTVTMDDSQYYESSHYRPAVAELIAARIFADASIAVPSDFGVLVTRQNRLRHLDALRAQFQKRAVDDGGPGSLPERRRSEVQSARAGGASDGGL